MNNKIYHFSRILNDESSALFEEKNQSVKWNTQFSGGGDVSRLLALNLTVYNNNNYLMIHMIFWFCLTCIGKNC